MKKTLIALMLFSNAAMAQDWVLTTKTATNFNNWNLSQSFGATYNFNPNFYAGAQLRLVKANLYGYNLTAGAQFANQYFTPYAELSFDQDQVKRRTVQYDLGVYAPLGSKVIVSGELDNPIKKDESLKFGASYKLADNLSVGASYYFAFNSNDKGVALGLSYFL